VCPPRRTAAALALQLLLEARIAGSLTSGITRARRARIVTAVRRADSEDSSVPVPPSWLVTTSSPSRLIGAGRRFDWHLPALTADLGALAAGRTRRCPGPWLRAVTPAILARLAVGRVPGLPRQWYALTELVRPGPVTVVRRLSSVPGGYVHQVRAALASSSPRLRGPARPACSATSES